MNDSRKLLCEVMIDEVFPALKEAIMNGAKTIVVEERGLEAVKDVFFVDDAAAEIMHEIVEFLLISTVMVEFDSRFLHPQQMTKKHYKSFWRE